MNIADTYQRVCTLAPGHDGDHLPFYLAPVKDGFGNKECAFPRCVHVSPIPDEDGRDRFRVVFEIIDLRMPRAGWHEVARETESLSDAEDQLRGLHELEAVGDDVRNARVERATVTWEKVA